MWVSGEEVPSVRTDVSVWATGVDGCERNGFELSTPESLDTRRGSTEVPVSDIRLISDDEEGGPPTPGGSSVEFLRGGEAVMRSCATWGYSG